MVINEKKIPINKNEILFSVFLLVAKKNNYAQEIAQILNKTPGMVVRYLQELEKNNFIYSEKEKNLNKTIYYLDFESIKNKILLFNKNKIKSYLDSKKVLHLDEFKTYFLEIDNLVKNECFITDFIYFVVNNYTSNINNFEELFALFIGYVSGYMKRLQEEK